MLSRTIDYLIDYKDRQRIAIALAKGGTSKLSREIDLRDPLTWEFSGFSQNGEDGIIDVLRSVEGSLVSALFVDRAPKEVVEETNAQKKQLVEALGRLEEAKKTAEEL